MALMEVKYIIETERLFLRELRSSDAEKMYDLNSDPDVVKFTGDIPFTSIESARAFLEKYDEYKKQGYGRWAVITKDSNEFIGWCGLKYNEEKYTDIGFRFFRKEWNKGYATEAAKATLEYGFSVLKLNEIIGRASTDNKPSIRVLEKLKMSFWKLDKCDGIENSSYFRISKAQYDRWK
ncbi:MAG: GNAT family N-acetyltransferase [Calditrichaceae bacterium]